ncbi:hypothetical protein BC828DRAFT_404497 [Blastocladiella britannica]|nr:hypothetical protein BC828DRAFT_404497 [Blastocladiella britannica]
MSKPASRRPPLPPPLSSTIFSTLSSTGRRTTTAKRRTTTTAPPTSTSSRPPSSLLSSDNMPHRIYTAMLAQSVAHALAQAGFSHFDASCLHALVDLMQRYLERVARAAADAASHAGRTAATVPDVDAALAAVGVDARALAAFAAAGWTKPMRQLDRDLRYEGIDVLPVPTDAQRRAVGAAGVPVSGTVIF